MSTAEQRKQLFKRPGEQLAANQQIYRIEHKVAGLAALSRCQAVCCTVLSIHQGAAEHWEFAVQGTTVSTGPHIR